MTINLSSETEAKLRERAKREEHEVNSLAETLICDALSGGGGEPFPGSSRLRRSAKGQAGKSRLERECEKLDPEEEQSLAEEGIKADHAAWPPY